MLRDIDLSEISDGRKYKSNDLVKIGSMDCNGCSSCCRVVGDSIILDPYDIDSLSHGLNKKAEMLINEEIISWRVVDGLIYPYLKFSETKEACPLLNEDGRCTVHDHRPGYCRLFPLGRIYEEDDFYYFYQVNECPYPNKTKVKIKDWLGIKNLPEYEEYVKTWHFFLKELQEFAGTCPEEVLLKQLNLYLMNVFYVKAYPEDRGFYSHFYERLEQAKQDLGISDS